MNATKAKKLNWKLSGEDTLFVNAIVERALKVYPDKKFDRVSLTMDITATHANGMPLNLKKFLEADAFNFAHDLFGINSHLDRISGKIMHCFLPRCSR